MSSAVYDAFDGPADSRMTMQKIEDDDIFRRPLLSYLHIK